MKTFLYIIAVLVVAWLFLHSDLSPWRIVSTEDKPDPTTAAAPAATPFATPAQRTPVPVPTPIPHALFNQLSLVRGIVNSVTADGIIISCDTSVSGSNWRAPANAGAGDIQAMAGASIAAEKKEYGDTLYLKDGQLQVGNSPVDRASGVVLLRDHPSEGSIVDNQKIKVVAINTGQVATINGVRVRVYSMKFLYDGADAKPGAWMWQNYQNPLNQPAH